MLVDDLNELLAASGRLAADIDRAVAEGAATGGAQGLDIVARRLRLSVVRPLSTAVGVAGTDAAPPGARSSADGAPSAPSSADGAADGVPVNPDAVPTHVGDAVWDLARRATRLRLEPGIPVDLQEATAALQDLACQLAADDGEDTPAARRAELASLQASLAAAIVPLPGGPLLATNVDTVVDWLGVPMPLCPQLALCRCGQSAIKPLCDGTHAEIGFRDEKDPKRVPDRLDTYAGQQVTITDNRGICAHSGFCTDRLPTAFRVAGEPFVAPAGARIDEMIRAARACPSGALGVALQSTVDAQHQADQRRDPAVEVSRDGPYRVTGGIPLIDADGAPVTRAAGSSEEHYSLCRCGHSLNKPFCSGMHWYVDFKDPRPDATPTLFAWAGGLPALTRMTRLFYERHVPDDPLLAPLFAQMQSDHPERVAAWLAEVLGGPQLYTQRYGGYQRMLSQHAGKGLTEAQRARWASLLESSADAAGLPADPEFRSAFRGYIEWGSRIALENSQPGAVPLPRMPVPRWDWGVAGRPAAQVTATDSRAKEPAATLPEAGAPVSFEEHIKPLFREQDRDAMRWAFDLASYADVVANSGEILARVRAGSMPCDAAWPAERVEVLQRWIDTGMRETASSSTSLATPGPAAAPQASDELGVDDIQGALGRAVALRSTAPVEERAIVIEHREPLIYMLCAAAELEHALMCEYLFAAFSLKRSVDEGLTQDQLNVVEGWRSVILGVAKQEMLHLAINCNLVTSLGASPHLSRPNLPQPARHYPGGVRLALLPFGEQALRHFLFLERPEGMDVDDAEGLDAFESAVPLMSAEEIAPHIQEFATVGHLYRSIEAGFRHLTERLGEEQLFLGPADAQAVGDLFGWPQLEPIRDLDGAVRAIEAIVEQGEGPSGHWRNAHFGRFVRVLNEYLEMLEANPGLEVTRPVLPALVRAPETGEQVTLITDPTTARIADLGNVAYEVLLQLLYRLLCHVDETEEQIKVLADVSVGLMFDVVEPLAEILTMLPVGPEHPGRTAGPSFELFYQPDYLLPHRRAAWLLMAEHLTEAAVLVDAEGAHDARLLPVATALRRHAEALRASAS
jgi:CDGSH-type Zn-finger protein/truncated hemoglobin YjbI